MITLKEESLKLMPCWRVCLISPNISRNTRMLSTLSSRRLSLSNSLSKKKNWRAKIANKEMRSLLSKLKIRKAWRPQRPEDRELRRKLKIRMWRLSPPLRLLRRESVRRITVKVNYSFIEVEGNPSETKKQYQHSQDWRSTQLKTEVTAVKLETIEPVI